MIIILIAVIGYADACLHARAGDVGATQEVNMKNSRFTGISSITGKTVYIRHATEWDRITVEDYLSRHKAERNLAHSDVVVAAEEDHIIGFGILEKGRDSSAGCLTIVENGRRRGIGAPIVGHLMDYASMKTVYGTPEVSHYLTRLGFAIKKTTPRKNAMSGENSMCRWNGKRDIPLAVYEKR